jgi:hypothetical protein
MFGVVMLTMDEVFSASTAKTSRLTTNGSLYFVDHQDPSGRVPLSEKVNRGRLIGYDIDAIRCGFALGYQAMRRSIFAQDFGFGF